jgi:hypothetical protein
MSRFAQGKFVPKNPQKYIGLKTPTYRSSWEWQFMRFCDTNPAIQQWACEAIQIPYRNPLTGKNSIYVPDFFIQYVDAKNRTNVDLIEIKPQNQAVLESVGKSKVRQAQYIQNQAKWAAANAWCRHQGIKFRIITENELFHNGSR